MIYGCSRWSSNKTLCSAPLQRRHSCSTSQLLIRVLASRMGLTASPPGLGKQASALLGLWPKCKATPSSVQMPSAL